MIYSWQTVNTGNLAEQVCRPTDYFDIGKPVTVIPNEIRTMPLDGPIIFGGSGLLYPEIATILESSANHSRHPLIAWGIGHNTHGGKKREYPVWLRKFALVGLRDWKTKYDYVPCPSCMHKAFDASYGKPVHHFVIYDQFDYPVTAPFPGVPRANNYHRGSEMERIIAFLASGETIITSSYHGVYWGYLLNRTVLIWSPWSTKFHTFKPTPVFVSVDDWQSKLSLRQDHRGYLQECRSLNVAFANRVKALLK